MERLTKIESGVPVYVGPGCESPGGSIAAEMSTSQVRDVLVRLGAYEDTGLAPVEIDMAREAAEALRKLCRLCDLDRLRKLAKADRDGRVVVLPCKIGDKAWCVYDDGEKKAFTKQEYMGFRFLQPETM